MSTVLECRALDAGHFKGHPVVREFDLSLEPGSVTALLGPNGAGKTTVLSTLAGLIPALGGTVLMDGHHLGDGNARAAARRKLVLVPDDRALFTTLTVRENLTLVQRRGSDGLERVLAWFPALGRRLKVAAGALSGGEQQMLAIGRALVLQPRVLLIDELSMGLAPIVVEELLPIVRRVATEDLVAVVLVEQHVRLALQAADRAVVLVHGATALDRPAADLLADPTLIEHAYLKGKSDAEPGVPAG